MASVYLTEILTYQGRDKVQLIVIAEKLEINRAWKSVLSSNVGCKTKHLIQQSNLLKTFVKTTLDSGNIDFEQLLHNNKILTTGANDLIEDISILQDDINTVIKSELSLCLKESEELSNSVKEINLIFTIFLQLSEMHSILNSAENKLINKEYYECARLIKDFQDVMKNDDIDLENIELHKSLANEGDECQKKLLQEMNTLWASYLKFDNEILEDVKISKFHIKLEFIEVITDILKASDCLQYESIENDFINKFLTKIVNEIILHRVIVRELSHGNKTLNIEILHTVNKPNYEEVFDNLKQVLEFLRQCLNVEIRDDIKFLDKIGTKLGIPLINTLIEDYLVIMIPNSATELENYNEIMDAASHFDIYLKESGFLPESCTSIPDHKAKISELFVERFCATYLEKARLIMNKDLNKKMYGDDLVITSLDKLPEDCCNILKNKLNIKTPSYVYSKAQISTFIKEVTDLIKQIMLEAMRSKDFICGPVLHAIVDIFEIYAAVVPLNYKESLEKVPLQAGLFHNNCLYLAYYLINIASELYERASPTLCKNLHIIFEAAASIRSLAKEKFEEHVTTQKNNLVDMIQNLGLTNIEETTPNSEGSVQQCMRQLELMEGTWKDLLPLKVYHRAMGFLLDSVIDEFISLIMTVEDIPCRMSTSLATTLSIILEKAPLLFLDPKEIFKHCAKWLKLKEFVLILQGSLKDVDERWSNGLGPLANEFTPEQVKHLIRALFQNSERRSELLNRIK